jgi:hypothetical protein
MNWLKSQLHYFHALKDAKLQARRVLLESASDELIKAIVECAINALKLNLKLSKEKKSKLNEFKNRVRALVGPEISFKRKHKLIVKKGGFIVPLLTSILTGVIGALRIPRVQSASADTSRCLFVYKPDPSV